MHHDLEARVSKTLEHSIIREHFQLLVSWGSLSCDGKSHASEMIWVGWDSCAISLQKKNVQDMVQKLHMHIA